MISVLPSGNERTPESTRAENSPTLKPAVATQFSRACNKKKSRSDNIINDY